MTRRLLTLASVLSLALCLATAVLWVRSYWVVDDLAVRVGPQPANPEPRYGQPDGRPAFRRTTCFVVVNRGVVWLRYGPVWRRSRSRPLIEYTARSVSGEAEENPAPAWAFDADWTIPGGGFSVTIPLWPIIVPSGALPLTYLIAVMRRGKPTGFAPCQVGDRPPG